MKLSMMLRPYPEPAWKLAKQAGVDYAVTNLAHLPPGRPLNRQTLGELKDRFAEAGLTLWVVESDPFPMDRIKLGLPGRDEDIAAYCDLLQMMGELRIPVMCYNFMAVLGWFRTRTDTPSRGGALAPSFDYELVRKAPLTAAGVVEQERLWDNLAYFLEQAVPAAEAAKVKLALHPDDPPVASIRGVSRIITSPDAIERALSLRPSGFHGAAFCQGTIAAMGVDLCETIRHFGRKGKLFFVHFRDIRGTAERFVETFHDDGQTDMLAAMRCYREVGFDGPIRPDHAPTMEGESNERPGYAIIGRIFAVGYMKGLLENTRQTPPRPM